MTSSAFGVEHEVSKALSSRGARTVAQMLGKEPVTTRGQAARGNAVRVLKPKSQSTADRLARALKGTTPSGPSAAALRRSAGY